MYRYATVGPAASRVATARVVAASSSSATDPVRQPEPQRLLGADAIGQVVELAGLRRSDQLGQEVAAAVVAGEADTGERGRHERRAGHDPQVARQCERQAATAAAPGSDAMVGLGIVNSLPDVACWLIR